MIMAIPQLKSQFELEQAKLQTDVDESNELFYTYDFTPLRQHLLKQLSEYSRIRSSLIFIKKESLDVLAVIREIYKNRQNYIDITKGEERAIFNTMSINNIPVQDFNIFLFKIADETTQFISKRFISPYSNKLL